MSKKDIKTVSIHKLHYSYIADLITKSKSLYIAPQRGLFINFMAPHEDKGKNKIAVNTMCQKTWNLRTKKFVMFCNSSQMPKLAYCVCFGLFVSSWDVLDFYNLKEVAFCGIFISKCCWRFDIVIYIQIFNFDRKCKYELVEWKRALSYLLALLHFVLWNDINQMRLIKSKLTYD